MAYQFPADVHEQIRQQLASGNYASEDEVIRDALQALRKDKELATFRESLAESRNQAARGDATALDIDAMMQRIKDRVEHPE